MQKFQYNGSRCIFLLYKETSVRTVLKQYGTIEFTESALFDTADILLLQGFSLNHYYVKWIKRRHAFV